MSESTFEDFARVEFQAADGDLSRVPPQEALVRFYRRLDTAITTAITLSPVKPACRSGCSYCCHYKVVARAVEVLAIHQYVVARFKPDQIKAVVTQAALNVSEASNLSHAEQVATNQRCPFLVDEKCSVYSVRPSKCRSFHAADVEGCKLSYDNPHDLSIPNSYVPEVFDAANGMSEGFQAATAQGGLDPRVYDLNSAFLEAMNSQGAAKRLKNGKKVFLNARTETPLGE
jgi:Fe-S-cluster containining protein